MCPECGVENCCEIEYEGFDMETGRVREKLEDKEDLNRVMDDLMNKGEL